MNKTLKIALLSIILGLSAALLWNTLREQFTHREAPPAPLPQPELPEGGVQSDAFSLSLFQAALEQQRNRGCVTVAPLQTKYLISLLAQDFMAGAMKEQAASFNMAAEEATQHTTAPSFLCDIVADDGLKLTEQRDTPLMFLPFRRDFPFALSRFNSFFADYFGSGYEPLEHMVSRNTRLIALSFCRYTLPWRTPFRTVNNRKADFDNANGGLPRVEMLRCVTALRLAEAEDGSWKAAAFFLQPTQDGDTPLALIGILPQGNAREFAAALTPQQLSAIRTALVEAPYTQAKAELPQLRLFTPAADIRPLLQAVGITAPFDSRQADFSPLTKEKVLLNGVTEQLEISLEGKRDELPEDMIPEDGETGISFNRPFLWMVGDLTTPCAPYFMGLVENL